MDGAQLDLLAPKPELGNNLDIRVARWVATPAGKTILRLFIAEAFEMRLQNCKHSSGKAIIERMRWQRHIADDLERKGFKLNNTWTSRLVRKAIADEPRLEGFFETRELQG